MARLYIAETDDLGLRAGDLVPVYVGGSNEIYQSVAIGATAASPTNALARNFARLTADAACHVAFGATAVKTAGAEVGFYLAAGQVLDIEVKDKGATTVSVIETV